jgi:DNA-3-methyladenine glycosylase II
MAASGVSTPARAHPLAPAVGRASFPETDIVRPVSRTKRAEKSADPFHHLTRVDPELAKVIARAERCPLPERAAAAPTGAEAFAALVRAIVSQQLSGKAADTIFGRVEALGGGTLPGAAELAAMPDETLRAAGLSGAKTRGVKDLAARVLRGELALDALHAHDDEAVITSLTAVKGIGRWTAEMFLMFRLGRPDVLSTADLGLRKGMMMLFGLKELPDPATMDRLSAHWRPFRSVACWYLWRVAEEAPPMRKAEQGAKKRVAKAGVRVAKKAAAKVAVSKKAVAKKAAAKKVVAKRAVAKRVVAKAAVSKKAISKRATPKRRARR